MPYSGKSKFRSLDCEFQESSHQMILIETSIAKSYNMNIFL